MARGACETPRARRSGRADVSRRRAAIPADDTDRTVGSGRRIRRAPRARDGAARGTPRDFAVVESERATPRLRPWISMMDGLPLPRRDGQPVPRRRMRRPQVPRRAKATTCSSFRGWASERSQPRRARSRTEWRRPRRGSGTASHGRGVQRRTIVSSVQRLREVSYEIAVAVARHAAQEGVAPIADSDIERRVRQEMWEPNYPEYDPL